MDMASTARPMAVAREGARLQMEEDGKVMKVAFTGEGEAEIAWFVVKSGFPHCILMHSFVMKSGFPHACLDEAFAISIGIPCLDKAIIVYLHYGLSRLCC